LKVNYFMIKTSSISEKIQRSVKRRFKNISAFLDHQARTKTRVMRVLPSFLILGTAKGGTTSLHRYLEKHPSVSPTLKKEVHFFDANFSKGLLWYRTYFPLKYKNLIAGDSTPFYLLHPHAPKRAFESVPQVKLIVLFRNPIDRAFSLHNMNLMRPDVNETLSFEDAIKAEPERLSGEMEKMMADESYASFNYERYSYLTGGLYLEQIKNWNKFFPKEQILILKSEDLFQDPATAYQTVLKFLNLPAWNLNVYKNANPREYSSPINLDTKKRLIAYFKPHNETLYDYLGVNYGWDEE
jgi:hypothetical protein